MVLMALPLGAVFVSVFPICALSKRAVKTETALIGLDSVEKYCNTAAVAFNDSEVFPSKGIKVTIVRAYGSHRIDKTILYAAKIFKKIGGPLATVFENSVSSIGGEITTDIEILEISPDGICAKIDGQEVFIGNKEYMLSYDFGYIKDQIDQVFENSVGRIMYMAIEDEIAAKFYIRYAISTGFEKLLRQLGSVGICASIRSCDPNIDNELLKHLLKKGDYPVGILKTPEAAKTHPVSPREDSGIVCTSTTANMLRGFILADKIKQRISANTLVKFISLLLGVFMVVFLYITGFSDKLDTFRMLLYHGLWLLPIIIPSLVE
ncbi:hypothetical protein SDC9_125439 [bioreactor metagenome]|uniref:Uncharacterized protein n=1 Tax=bioreactor metagenome TaxID=1076179 RepID=A0A645CNE0_9ZZZZ